MEPYAAPRIELGLLYARRVPYLLCLNSGKSLLEGKYESVGDPPSDHGTSSQGHMFGFWELKLTNPQFYRCGGIRDIGGVAEWQRAWVRGE